MRTISMLRNLSRDILIISNRPIPKLSFLNRNFSLNSANMAPLTAKTWVLNNKVRGLPKLEDFSCKEEQLPECKKGDIVIKAEYLSVDPYMRYRIAEMKAGDIPPGSQVSEVIESGNDEFPVGTHVVSYPGWRDTTHLTKEQIKNSSFFPIIKVPEMGPLPRSLALGALGLPGATAYFGLLELCDPQPGETVLVNGAAGAVGTMVCQIAKIKGCRVIAFAGTDSKVKLLKDLGLDHVYNYKTKNVSDAIKEAAPKGVDCYFDNVGGEFSQAVVPHLADYARVSLCGVISSYNDTREENLDRRSPYLEKLILVKQLRVQGFIAYRWASRWMEAVGQMSQWIKEDKIKYHETITEGFECLPQAFIGLFHGENTGKAIIKAKV